MTGKRESSTPGDATVVAPRFDEFEEATARPVVPLGRPQQGDALAGRRAASRPSLRAASHQLLLAWAVVATLAAGGIAVYRSGQTTQTQAASQPTSESATAEATPTPQRARRETNAAPARAAKVTAARDSLPSWEGRAHAGGEDAESVDRDDEDLDERARKEEKRLRKEEKKRREEAEKENERALKEARKQAERRREKMKDEGRKPRLVGVIDG